MITRPHPLLMAAILSIGAFGAAANTPPSLPVILEPAEGSVDLSPEDVHMVTAPFEDANPGDGHLCSDWEIRTADSGALAWSAPCAAGPLALHIHLGDGAHHELPALSHESEYVVRVRHRDDSGEPETEWSEWAEREFFTGPARSVFPMRISAVVDEPAPRWVDAAGVPIVTSTLALELRHPDGAVLLRIGDPSGASGEFVPSDEHRPVLVRLTAGESGVTLSESVLEFHDRSVRPLNIYLPALTLGAEESISFWIAADGGSWYAGEESEPSFHALARGGPVPWSGDPGVRIERVATGFRLPVALAFAPEAGHHPDAPWLYVAELYGTIRLVARDGTVSEYARDLIGFDASGPFPGNGEQGIGGMAVDPVSGDLFVTLPQPGADGTPVPRVIRLFSTDGGRTASGSAIVLELTGIHHVASHQISEITIGPDRHLYVHVGDGGATAKSRDLDSFFGKILRVALDGSAPPDNPFYDSSDGITTRDYVYMLGLRNPFGGAWRARDDSLYVVDNGPNVDRIVKGVPGADQGWDGSEDRFIENSVYAWFRSVAPIRMGFLQPETFGGSGFPDSWMDSGVVTESGATWGIGPRWVGKRLMRFPFNEDGSIRAPQELARYVGSGRGTAAALAAGPDGLYFSDLYRDYGASSPLDPGASVFRIRFVGSARFDLRRSEEDPLTIELTDASDLPGASAREWTIGEEPVPGGRALRHTFDEQGVYPIRLRVSNGTVESVAGTSFLVGRQRGKGLLGEYFPELSMEGEPLLRRIDPRVDFNWGYGSPAEGMPEDHFMVRWSGMLEARVTGEHRFHAISDDGVRAWVDGQQVINAWGGLANPGSAWLVAGQRYEIRVEYFENGGEAIARLSWSTPFHEPEPIPASALLPPAGPRRRVAVRETP